MKAVALFSGGKDSFLSALIAGEQGFDIQHFLTIDPQEYSMMFHYPNAAKSDLPALLLGKKVVHIEEEDFRDAIESERDSGIQAVISGAIASEYQKTRIERMCTELGMVSYNPLWRKDQRLILRKILESGMRAIVVSVSAEGLTESDVGRPVDGEFIRRMEELNRTIGINIAGEGGEYETFVVGLEGSGKVVLDSESRSWQGSVGYLLIEKAHYESFRNP